MLQVFVWLASAVVVGGAGFLLVGATYDEFMDCSNPEIHESANTTFGWTVAAAASALPVAVATWLAGGLRRELPALAIATAMLSMVIWWWMLDKDCEWYSLSQI